MHNLVSFAIFNFLFATAVMSQINYGYGTVIGGDKNSEFSGTNYLSDNEQGIKIVLLMSSGSAFGGGGGGGAAKILDVPKDTDYLELIMFYSGINPRNIRQGKIKILRIASTGQSPYMSKDIQRYWTSYNFEQQYDRGGPFDLVRPGDIIIVESRGIFNREFFDPITDITFLLTLPTLEFSVLSVYNTFIK